MQYCQGHKTAGIAGIASQYLKLIKGYMLNFLLAMSVCYDHFSPGIESNSAKIIGDRVNRNLPEQFSPSLQQIQLPACDLGHDKAAHLVAFPTAVKGS